MRRRERDVEEEFAPAVAKAGPMLEGGLTAAPRSRVHHRREGDRRSPPKRPGRPAAARWHCLGRRRVHLGREAAGRCAANWRATARLAAVGPAGPCRGDPNARVATTLSGDAHVTVDAVGTNRFGLPQTRAWVAGPADILRNPVPTGPGAKPNSGGRNGLVVRDDRGGGRWPKARCRSSFRTRRSTARLPDHALLRRIAS